MFNREKRRVGWKWGGGKKWTKGQKNKWCFKFQIDYLNYDAKNLKMKSIVRSRVKDQNKAWLTDEIDSK
jgi:dolichyl-phosphate-mannose--protein O-mannosyl transferase